MDSSPFDNRDRIFDDGLNKLLEAGEITSYTYVEEGDPLSQSVVIEFPSGRKLLVGSWSTPAPESSGLSFEIF